VAPEADRSAALPAPLDSFFQAILVTRLDRRSGWIVVLGLAGLVALVAVNQGIAMYQLDSSVVADLRAAAGLEEPSPTP